MMESDAFVQAMQDMGINFFTGVPDSILGGIIAELMNRRLYTPAVREDEAVAMAAGAYMAGKIPAVLMQNSGLGTSLNRGEGCAGTSRDGRSDAAVSRYDENSPSHPNRKDGDRRFQICGGGLHEATDSSRTFHYEGRGERIASMTDVKREDNP
jgi:hypothetical protein